MALTEIRARWSRLSGDDKLQVVNGIVSLLVCMFCLTLPSWVYAGLWFEVLDYVFSPLACIVSAMAIWDGLGL